MTDVSIGTSWFLQYSELERTLEQIAERNVAGLMQDYASGLAVLRPKENQRRLLWYRELQLELARLVSGWISTAETFRTKMDLGRQAWLFMEVASTLDTRLRELPGSSVKIEATGRGHALRLQLAHARNENEFIIGVFQVVQAQLLARLVEHVNECDPLADWPTRDVLERAIALMRAQTEWSFARTKAYIESTSQQELASWCNYVAESFAVLGGTHGTHGLTQRTSLPEHPFEHATVQDACAEPSRLESGYNVTDAFMMAEPRETEGALSDILFHNFGELIVPEGLGYMVYDLDAMPFEFYRTFIRQIWDESRHTEMGVRELKRLGIDVSALPMNRLRRPPNYTEMLCVIGFTGEACSFPRKFEAVEAFYKLGHPHAGLVTEYDIVDEHSHVLNIRKWLPRVHEREQIGVPLEAVIQKVQTEALERWSSCRTERLKNLTRAKQSVGRYGMFCREVDFEIDFNRVSSRDA